MKTTIKIALLLFISAFAFQSCQDNDDIAQPQGLAIQNFIWSGMNQFYLWQEDVPNLANDRFADQTALDAFLQGYPVPEELFDALLFKTKDKFSWIVDDYLELEGQIQGTTKNNGVEFGLKYRPGSTTNIFGYVRYIINDSDASSKNIKRGDVFTAVNGTQLTVSNYQSLLFGANENYTLNLADYNGTDFVTNGKTVDLTKTVLTENPILINKVITSGTHKIGYLMYNGFYSNFDGQLNDAFGFLKSQGITDLVLDLRYNGGGSVQTATRLASMITGQFTGQIFSKLEWNSNYSDNNTNYLFPSNIDAASINSVNMAKIYVLTTKGTASASELVINGLKPYINVVQIGDVTYGKNVASITLYDSPTFSSTKRNPNHRYAMQPIVAKTSNSVGFGDYPEGLQPDFLVIESISTYGVLGDPSEPLLSYAIGKINGTNRMMRPNTAIDFEFFKDSKSMRRFQNEMYLEETPKGLLKALE